MGYSFQSKKELSFHHLIKFRRDGGRINFKNGVILVRDTSHDYLHLIESVDDEYFIDITLEMIAQKLNGKIDEQSLRTISDILRSFERNYCHLRNKAGKPLIKKEYTRRVFR